jgi:hypothetical protein
MSAHARGPRVGGLPVVAILGFCALIALVIIGVAIGIWAAAVLFLVTSFLGVIGLVYFVGFYGTAEADTPSREASAAGSSNPWRELSPRGRWRLEVVAATTVVAVAVCVLWGLATDESAFWIGSWAVAGLLVGIGIGLLLTAILEDPEGEQHRRHPA